jgi:hypothetical protein
MFFYLPATGSTPAAGRFFFSHKNMKKKGVKKYKRNIKCANLIDHCWFENSKSYAIPVSAVKSAPFLSFGCHVFFPDLHFP